MVLVFSHFTADIVVDGSVRSHLTGQHYLQIGEGFDFFNLLNILAVTEPSILGSEVAVMTIGQVNLDQ